jgi:molybdopterin synthase catalytic subunit
MADITTAIIGDDASMQGFAAGSVPAQAGAVATFIGLVRDHDQGRGVTELEYVGHDSAEQVLREAVAAVMAKHPEVLAVRVAHRVGLLAVGDRAFYVEVASAHRGAAFAACAEIVEDVKRLLPIWKRQVFTDASEEWVNSP